LASPSCLERCALLTCALVLFVLLLAIQAQTACNGLIILDYQVPATSSVLPATSLKTRFYRFIFSI
ncbi:MAG: hypothetical protein LBE09_02480, partial [Christensenellaceae bacterium]|nr:hypothetical protein [Christensenellaceae bacterium]